MAGRANTISRVARRKAVAATLNARTRTTQFSLILDRFIAASWPLLATALVFLAVSRLGLWSQASDEVRLAMLGGFALLTLYGLWTLVRRFRWPGWSESRRRLDDGHEDRPVASFDDNLAIGEEDRSSNILWNAHQTRVAAAAAKISPTSMASS